MKNLWPVSLTICQALEAVLWNIWCVLASTKQRVFQVCVIHWSLSKNKVSEQISMFQIQSCAEQQIWLDDLSKKREFAQIPIEEHSHSRWGLNAASSSWRCAKAEKLFLAGIWIDCNQSSKKCCKWKAITESHVESVSQWRPVLTGQVSTFDSNKFWAIYVWKSWFTVLLTNHQLASITWSWRSVLNDKFSVFTFLRLMTCSMHCQLRKTCAQGVENISTPIYVQSWLQTTPKQYYGSIKVLQSRIFVGPEYSTWAIQKYMQKFNYILFDPIIRLEPPDNENLVLQE